MDQQTQHSPEYLARRHREFKEDKNLQIKGKLMQRLIDRFTQPVILVMPTDLSMNIGSKWMNSDAEAEYNRHHREVNDYIRANYADLITYADEEEKNHC